jgi:putative tRNA adenosine deaminase-associated protein
VSLVAYFAAVLARTDGGWDVSETELDTVETLADLADLARESAQDDDSVLIFIEQEDAWFAVVRVDGEDDPRIFVSDGAAAARSSYGSVLTDELIDSEDFDDLDALVADVDDDDEESGFDGAAAGSDDEDEDDADGPLGAQAGPLGDSDLLADFGLAARELLALAAAGAVPGDALAEIADALGAGEVLEAVR